MKRKFNLYCVLMLIAIVGGLTLDLVTGMDMAVDAFMDGWNSVPNCDEQQSDQPTMISYAALRAVDNGHYGYAIPNRKTNRMEPMQLTGIKFKTAQKDPLNSWTNLSIGVCSWIFVIAIVMFWFHFIKLILAVNRGMAFDRPVERRLRFIGWLLIVMYAAEWGMELLFYRANGGMIDVPGYEVVMDDHPSLMLLLTGIGMLLVSQIFAIGRRMKEEQELTI